MKLHKLFNTALKRPSGWACSLGAGVVLLVLNVLPSAAFAEGSKWVSETQLNELVDPRLVPEGARVDVKFVKTDDRIGSAKCPAALFANTHGNKFWGRTFVRVQCIGSDTAPFFLAVDVKVWAPVLVVKSTVQSGQALGPADVEFRSMDLSQLNNGWVAEMAHLNNKTAAKQLWPGTLLKPDHLRGQALIKNGDTVKVMMTGPGFAIGGTAVAMNEAELGEVVKIKTGQGKILHGVARDALLVEVSL